MTFRWLKSVIQTPKIKEEWNKHSKSTENRRIKTFERFEDIDDNIQLLILHNITNKCIDT